MDLTSIVDAIPDAPELDVETFRDNRTKMHLLYREGEERVDVMVTPYGDDLKGKKDITTYIRLLPVDGAISSTWQDALLKYEAVKGGNYLTIQDETRKAVLPFKVKGEFPEVIMPGSFAQDIADCNERVIGELISLIENVDDFKNDRVDCSLKNAKKIISDIFELYEHIQKVYNPLRDRILEAFDGENSPSEMLPRVKRKFKHYHLKDIESHCVFAPSSKSYAIAKSLVNTQILNPVRHFYYSTEENRTFGVSQSKRNLKQTKAFLDYLKSESPKAFEFIKADMQENEGLAAKWYHRYLVLGSLGSLVTGNFLASGGLIGLWLAEKNVSKRNANRSGFHTGLVGTMCDKFGLTRKLVSPFDLISEEYDLGMWKGDDLK